MSIRKFKQGRGIKALAFALSLMALGVAADQNYVGLPGNFTGGTVAGATTFSSSVTVTSGQVLSAYPYRCLSPGSAAVPCYSPTGDIDTGVWFRAAGLMDFTANGVNQAEIYDGGGGAGYLQINSNSQYNWSGGVPGVTVADTGMARVTAGVVGATNGTTGAGWFRNTAGELALNADYTNATATYSNTALSATVISGRTYSFDLELMLTESTAADGVKIDFNGGSAAATNFRVGCVLTNDVGTIVTQTSAVSTTLAGVISATATVTTAQHRYSCSGSFVPSGAGTFIVRAGQVAHTTGTLTVHRGSWLNIRDANSL